MGCMKNRVFTKSSAGVLLSLIASTIFLCSCSQNPDISHKVYNNLKNKYPLYNLVNDTMVSMSDVFGVDCDEIFIFEAQSHSDIAYVLSQESFPYRTGSWERCCYVVLRNKGKFIRGGNWFSNVIMYAFIENIVIPHDCAIKNDPFPIFQEHTFMYGHLYADSLLIGKYSEIQYRLSPIHISDDDSLMNTRLHVQQAKELCLKKKSRAAYQHSEATSLGSGLAMWDYLNLVSGDSIVTFYKDKECRDVKCCYNLFSSRYESSYPMPFLYKPASAVFYFITLEHTDEYTKILYNNADTAYVKMNGSFKYVPWMDFLRHNIIGVRRNGDSMMNRVLAVWNNKILIRDERSKWHIIPWRQDDQIALEIIVF